MTAETWLRESAPDWRRGTQSTLISWRRARDLQEAIDRSAAEQESVRWGLTAEELRAELDEAAPAWTTNWVFERGRDGHVNMIVESKRLFLREDAPLDKLREIVLSVPGKSLCLYRGFPQEKRFSPAPDGGAWVSADGLVFEHTGYGCVARMPRAGGQPGPRGPERRHAAYCFESLGFAMLEAAREKLRGVCARLKRDDLESSPTNATLLRHLADTLRQTALLDGWCKPSKEERLKRVGELRKLLERWRALYPVGCRARGNELFTTFDQAVAGLIKSGGRVKTK